MRKSGRKKGFLFVEASLMLPVFLIGALTISSFIPFLAIQERMTGAFAQEAADTHIWFIGSGRFRKVWFWKGNVYFPGICLSSGSGRI